MAARFGAFRGRFPGFTDVFMGAILGAGITKVYYETTGVGAKDERSTTQEEIQKIIQKNQNLKFGKHLRTIDVSNDGKDSVDSSSEREFSKYGVPQSPLRYLKYTNYWVCYDQARKIPVWVAEHLTRDKVKGDADRKMSDFTVDFNVPAEFQARNEDYLGTGWSRGHMAPAGNNKFNQDAMNETFFLSNIVPQDFDNNSSFWYRLETYCRSLTKRYSNVYIVSGPLFLPEPSNTHDANKLVKYEVIGESKVAVPTHLFKVVLAETEGKQPVLGTFIVPNKSISVDHQLTEFQVPLNELTKNSGITFFTDTVTSNAANLCEADGCQLLSKEFMERISLGRILRNCKSVEQLDQVWADAAGKGSSHDKINAGIYTEKKKSLEQVHVWDNKGLSPLSTDRT